MTAKWREGANAISYHQEGIAQVLQSKNFYSLFETW